ncbi:ATP-binding protein [Kitasatospora sp. GP30]|uniref:ATP-binding protein n=1 Tax=Kitasatospora sp. GP30 TaxID=3035084 RepID=UPI002476A1FE|nr:ATP-binding protein [Kitasatospora sp. GP30]
MSWELPAELSAVPLARARLRAYLEGLLDPETCSDAALVATELVANAAAASAVGGGIELRVEVGGGSLRIEVFDCATDTPKRRCADESAEGGRGLHLVEELTSLWGWHPVEGGKVVWAVL